MRAFLHSHSFQPVSFVFNPNVLLFCIATILFAGCRESEERDDALAISQRREDSLLIEKKMNDTLNARKMRKALEKIPLIEYKKLVISSSSVLDSVKKTFRNTPSNTVAHKIFTTLNRKELRFLRLRDTVIVPNVFSSDVRHYSVFPPEYPPADTIEKLILISNALQGYGCYERGKLVRFAACNTGREAKPTFPGRYSLNWRDKIRRSSLDSSWVLPFTWNFHLYAGSAFHQFEMPGRPVSHSCVRQFMEDAEWLYTWGKGGRIDSATKKHIPLTGTPVIILDIFDFTRKKGGPWLDLPSNKHGILSLPSAPMQVEEALIPISQIPPEVRWELPGKERYLFAEDTLKKRGIIRAEVSLSESINYNKMRREKAKAQKIALQNALRNKEKRNNLPSRLDSANSAH